MQLFSRVLSRKGLLIVVVLWVASNDIWTSGYSYITEKGSVYGAATLKQFKHVSGRVLQENVLQIHPRHGPLSIEEQQLAGVAWQYFIANTNPKTGLVNAIHHEPVASMWHVGSTIAALVSAVQLQLIDNIEYRRRVNALLLTLHQQKLFQDKIPNRFYSVNSGKPINYKGKAGEFGYSPIEIGRLLTWLRILREKNPELAGLIDRITLRWNYCGVIDQGVLYAGSIDRDNVLHVLQQGRLGYEEYAAKGFRMWGFNADAAATIEPVIQVQVEKQNVYIDSRDVNSLSEKSFLMADSYLLDGIEYAWDNPRDTTSKETLYTDTFSYQQAQRLYTAQRQRFERTSLLTAKSEYELPGPPYFVYDTIYANGKAWNTINELGEGVPQYTAMTTKAAIAMWVLWDSPFTTMLFNRASALIHQERGLYEGVYERSQELIASHTLNTNAQVLEALLFKVQGKIVAGNTVAGLWELQLKYALAQQSNPQCYPLRSVCTDNCSRITGIDNNGIANKQSEVVKKQIEQIKNERAFTLQAFQPVE